ARRALGAGEADYLLWDRFMTQPVVDRGELRRVGVQPTPWPAFVTVARTDVIDERGDDLSAIIAAVAATAAGLTRSDDLIDRLVDRFELAREVAADWWAVTRWGRADDQLTPEQLGEVQRTLLRLGRIDEILPAEQILAAPVA
ncbi:MAG: hypothetical protein OEU32_19290, partial [Acidimicrobiia bacterium]|nr:hypothetical protein [Acidimicrobiia bacterium]